MRIKLRDAAVSALPEELQAVQHFLLIFSLLLYAALLLLYCCFTRRGVAGGMHVRACA